jgi:DNA-binding NarL/FixJ family response regulator
MIRLFLVDDELAVRKGLRMRLAAELDILVVGEAADGASALDLIPALDPDVVLMDLELPCLDGLATTQALQALAPNITVIVLTIHDDADMEARARAAGASAFITKRGTKLGASDQLLAAIRHFKRGREKEAKM